MDQFKFVVIVEEQGGTYSFHGAKTRDGANELLRLADKGGARKVCVKRIGQQTSRVETLP